MFIFIFLFLLGWSNYFEAIAQPSAVLSSRPLEVDFQVRLCRETLRYGQRDEKDFQICYEKLSFAIQNVLNLEFYLTTYEKKRALESAEDTLEVVRDLTRLSANEVDSKLEHENPTQSQLAILENLVLRYVSLVQSKETWDARFSLGVAQIKFQDGALDNQIHAGSSFQFDLGSSFEGRFDLNTSSSRYEYDGYLSVPLEEVNWLSVTQAWVRWKKFQRFIFTIGRFPDEPSFLTPRTWPFTSVQGEIAISRSRLFGLNFLIRHDRYGTFLPELNSPNAAIVERTLTQLKHSGRIHFLWGQLLFESYLRFHWYADSRKQLGKLALGRVKLLGDATTSEAVDYRILHVASRMSVQLDSSEDSAIDLQGEFLRNVALERGNFGFVVGAGASYTWPKSIMSHAEVYRAAIGCAVLPPLASASFLMPGFSLTGLRLTTDVLFSEQLKIGVFLRSQGYLRKLAGQNCSPSSLLQGDIPRWGGGVSLSYALSNELLNIKNN